MKTNTTLRIAMICVVCAVMAMSGCLDSDDNGSVIESEKPIDAASKDTVFDADLILGHYGKQGTMEVELYDDNTATIITTTGSGEVIETGAWQFYRESADHRMYDVTTDDTELRLAFQNGGHAIAYIYEDNFMKCGEPFYGVWEQIGEATTEDQPQIDETDEVDDDEPISNDNSGSVGNPDIPVTFYMNIGVLYGDTDDIIRIVLEENGTTETCGVTMFPGKTVHAKVQGECVYGSWTQGATDRQYDIAENELSAFCITRFDDGTAEYDFGDGISLDGIWEECNDRP